MRRHHPLPAGSLTTIAGSGIVEQGVLLTYIGRIAEKSHLPICSGIEGAQESEASGCNGTPAGLPMVALPV